MIQNQVGQINVLSLSTKEHLFKTMKNENDHQLLKIKPEQ